MQDRIKAEIKESIDVKNQVSKTLVPQIEQAAKLMIAALKNGNKILFFGNGGSAADSQHLAGELIGRFLKDRKSLPAIALTTDSSILTCLSNDFGFDTVFARQIEGLAKKGDVAFGISTSGNSKNVLEGFKKAKDVPPVNGAKAIPARVPNPAPIPDGDSGIKVFLNQSPTFEKNPYLIPSTSCGEVADKSSSNS